MGRTQRLRADYDVICEARISEVADFGRWACSEVFVSRLREAREDGAAA